jgi:tetratricopeptide (TPR) repeat protein
VRPGPALVLTCAASVWGLAALPIRARGDAPQRGNEIVTALERYARGDEKAVDWLVSRYDDFDAFRSPFTRTAQSWIHSGDADGTAARRRVLAAAFALEAAFHRSASTGLIVRGTGPQLVSWAADVIAQANQPEIEHAWFRAAIALGEREVDPRWLLGADLLQTMAATRTGGFALKTLESARESALIGRAQRRFPGDPVFLLADVRAIERDTWPLGIAAQTGNRTSTPIDDSLDADELARMRTEAEAAGGKPNDAGTLPRPVLMLVGRLDALARVEPGYAKLAAREPVRAEALLRLAYHELRVGKIEAALPRLEQVPAATIDPFLRYFAHYFRAWALERSGRRELAEQPYRDAIRELPRGSDPARMRLAALLMLSGRRAEAAPLVNDTLPRRTGSDETWELFKRGDARLLPELLRRLREAAR